MSWEEGIGKGAGVYVYHYVYLTWKLKNRYKAMAKTILIVLSAITFYNLSNYTSDCRLLKSQQLFSKNMWLEYRK